MIQQTKSYTEWQESGMTKGFIDHVVPTEETQKLLQRLECYGSFNGEIVGYRLQHKTLDLWVESHIVEGQTLEYLEKLGLTFTHALFFKLGNKTITIYATYNKYGTFGQLLPSHKETEKGLEYID